MKLDQSVIRDLKNGTVLAGIESRTLVDAPKITFYELANVIPAFFMAWVDRASIAMCGQRIFDVGYVVDANSPGLVAAVEFKEFKLTHPDSSKTYSRASIYSPEESGVSFKLGMIKSGLEMGTSTVGSGEADLISLVDESLPHGSPIDLPARHEINLLIFSNWMKANRGVIEREFKFDHAGSSPQNSGGW